MKQDLAAVIAEIRLLVGYLGEKAQFSWWQSAFFSPQIDAFLSPVFPRTIQLAKYRGVCTAAQIVHDELVGKGSFHLYRLPDMWERSSADLAKNLDVVSHISSVDTALDRLRELGRQGESSEGPVNLGKYSDEAVDRFLTDAAGHYLRAFESDIRTYPYLRDQERVT